MNSFGVKLDVEFSAAPKPRRGQRRKTPNIAWQDREFIAWDGEGIATEEPVQFQTVPGYYWPGSREVFWEHQRQAQPYVLLANSKDEHIIDQDGLSTFDCFEFMLDTKQQHPTSIFVGFGLNYDVNQMLKDLHPVQLLNLYERNIAYDVKSKYRIKWFPRKFLQVVHGPTHRSFTLYDTFSFFQTSFLQACRSYLGKDDPDLGIIEAGKEHRAAFKWEELEDYIIPYNKMELSMLVRMMNILRNDLDHVDIHPGQWYGPGAVANKVLRKYKVPITRDIPEGVQDAAQFAYAGGRFELFYVGRHESPVYEYDIRSAYPAAASTLPDLSDGTWESVEGFQPDTFGVWDIKFDSRFQDGRPQPLFCRAENGSISYPYTVSGWYWTPEASLCPDSVRSGYVFHPRTSARPFDFVKEMYQARKEYKRQGISAERALKLVLNSLYGKLAQTVGGKGGPPRWHQLEWAGYITSYTRAKLYRAMMLNPSAIIAAETDAVFSMEPLNLPISEQLGDWERIIYDDITYLQSGFYYARYNDDIICRYRGMDRDGETGQPVGLPYRTVLDHLRDNTGRLSDSAPPEVQATPPLHCYTTRFIGIGMALNTESIWRSWERKHKVVSLDQTGTFSKREHIMHECLRCLGGISMYDQMHPLTIAGHKGQSYARSLPWKEEDTPKHLYFTMDDRMLREEGMHRFDG